MTIEVQCPKCHKKIRAPEKFAGQAAKCPACHAIVHLPALGGDAAASAQPAAGKPGAAKPPTAGSGAQGAAGGAGAAAARAGSAPGKPTGARDAASAGATAKKAAESKAAAAKPSESKAAATGTPVQAAKPGATQRPAAHRPAQPIVEEKEQPEAEDQWYVQTEENEQYGPVSKEELDAWVAEQRVDAGCQILKEGWSKWKWAAEVYPELADADAAVAEEENPFAAVAAASAVPAAGAVNPFTSPRSTSAVVAVVAEPGAAETIPVSATMRRALQETRPWVMLMGVVWAIAAAGMVLGSLGILVMGLMLIAAAGAAGLAVVFLSLLYGGLAAVVALLAVSTLRYGSAIGVFLGTRDGHDLDRGLDAQKTVWKILGITTLVALGISFVAPILLMALGGLAALVGGAGAGP